MAMPLYKSSANGWSSKAGSIINMPYMALFIASKLVVLFQKGVFVQ